MSTVTSTSSRISNRTSNKSLAEVRNCHTCIKIELVAVDV